MALKHNHYVEAAHRLYKHAARGRASAPNTNAQHRVQFARGDEEMKVLISCGLEVRTVTNYTTRRPRRPTSDSRCGLSLPVPSYISPSCLPRSRRGLSPWGQTLEGTAAPSGSSLQLNLSQSTSPRPTSATKQCSWRACRSQPHRPSYWVSR